MVKATPRLLDPRGSFDRRLGGSVGQSGWDRTQPPQGSEPQTVYKIYSSVFVFACEFVILKKTTDRMFENRVLI